MTLARSALLVGLVTFSVSTAHAHYLWVGIDHKQGDHGQANVAFEESPIPRDGRYLDPFLENGKGWVTVGGKTESLDLKEAKEEGKRWMTAALAKDGPRSVDANFKYGVYRYGKTDVLLHYYARHLDIKKSDDLKDLKRAEHLKLDIVPSATDSGLTFQVLWQGKPAANRPFYVYGPKLRKTLKTDDKGHVTFPAEMKGQYRMRTYVELSDPGTDGGKDYSLIRHHCSLVVRLPLR